MGSGETGPGEDGLVAEIDWISEDLSLGSTLVDHFLQRVGGLVGAQGVRLVLHLPESGVVYQESCAGRMPEGAGHLETLGQFPLGRKAVEGEAPVQEDSDPNDSEVGAVLCVPLREERLSGHLAFFRYGEKAPFEERDVETAGLFAQQLAANLLDAREVALEQRRVSQLTTLTQLTGLVSSKLDLESVKRVAIETAITLMDCEAASLLLLDDRQEKLRFEVAVGEKGEEVTRIELGADEGIAGWVVQSDEPFLSNDIPNEELHSCRVDEAVRFETRQLLAVPVRIGDKVLGCLEALNARDPAGFRKLDVPVFQALANQVAVAVENARLVAELRRRAETIEQQQEALIQSEKQSAMGQLSAGVAHEIRSPLSAISGYAQLIRRRNPEDNILRPVKTIEDAASHINRIVNGLLDFARKDEPNYESVHVHDVLERAMVLARPTLERYKHVVVIQELAEGLPPVHGDRRQLQQVFLNLMLNAAQAMSDGGTLTVKTFGEPPAGDEDSEEVGRVVMLFQDTGPGISEDDQDRVFQPFFTTGKEGGMGLGLSICRSIVQNHRGAITFETVPGQGTTFRVHMPAEGW